MSVHHSVVWLDHTEAKIFHFDADAIRAADVRAPDAHAHVHSRKAEGGRHDAHESYLHEVAQALRESPEILIVGPSSAKLEFIRHVHRHDAALEKRVVGVETVDHPTDGQLVAYAKKYFRAADRMR